jgi:hypothetical protein
MFDGADLIRPTWSIGSAPAPEIACTVSGGGILQSSSLKGFEYGAQKSGHQISRGWCKA